MNTQGSSHSRQLDHCCCYCYYCYYYLLTYTSAKYTYSHQNTPVRGSPAHETPSVSSPTMIHLPLSQGALVFLGELGYHGILTSTTNTTLPNLNLTNANHHLPHSDQGSPLRKSLASRTGGQTARLIVLNDIIATRLPLHPRDKSREWTWDSLWPCLHCLLALPVLPLLAFYKHNTVQSVH